MVIVKYYQPSKCTEGFENSVNNILYIQVKLELPENLAVAPMQRFHEIKRPSSKDTKQENLKILSRNKF